MHLATYHPRRGFRTVNHGLRLFDDFFAPPSGSDDNLAACVLSPRVDIFEKDDRLIIEADLPGLDREDIKVDVRERLLTLSGERNNRTETKEQGRYRSERRYGRFERSFRLPFSVTEAQIDAVYKNGVLTLAIEKPEEQKPKQITIN